MQRGARTYTSSIFLLYWSPTAHTPPDRIQPVRSIGPALVSTHRIPYRKAYSWAYTATARAPLTVVVRLLCYYCASHQVCVLTRRTAPPHRVREQTPIESVNRLVELSC